MSNFQTLIDNYIRKTINENDKKIMQIGANILSLEPIITGIEIETLNEMFKALKEDYTLVLSQDYDTLEPEILIVKQEIPIIQNKHNINVLYTRLVVQEEISELENTVLLLFNSCEHIEESEIIMIDRIINLIENNWSFKGIKTKLIDDVEVRYSILTFNLEKKLVKSK